MIFPYLIDKSTSFLYLYHGVAFFMYSQIRYPLTCYYIYEHLIFQLCYLRGDISHIETLVRINQYFILYHMKWCGFSFPQSYMGGSFIHSHMRYNCFLKERSFFPTIPLEIDEHPLLFYKGVASLFLCPN